MAGFRMSLLAEIRNEFAIRAVMRKVNRLLHESTDRDKFVTAFYGVLDYEEPRAHVLERRPQPADPAARATARSSTCRRAAWRWACSPDASYEERPIALRPGDVLVLYTDGVSEAESPTGEQFGVQRIEQLVETAREPQRPATIVDAHRRARAGVGAASAARATTLTLVVLKVKLETI